MKRDGTLVPVRRGAYVRERPTERALPCSVNRAGRGRRRPGSRSDVLFKEKRREDALRDLGWQIVRWLWADLYRPGVIRDRVLRAFARAY
jgi:hypothetical protein